MMIGRAFCRDSTGASAVEFGITAPLFFMLLIGVVQGSMMLWTQLGIQQGVEMGARCASVDSVLCGSTSAVLSYAAQQTYGLNPPPSTFTLTAAACGNELTASYPFPVFSSYFGSVTLTAKSCFAK
jgi:Flp pilus assembly protein TadG